MWSTLRAAWHPAGGPHRGAGLFVIGMRTRHPLLLHPLFWLMRSRINPRSLRTAGTPGASASIIRHRGRVSGRDLETPVDVVQTDAAFLVALPYGTHANWVRNVLASGSAAVVHDGAVHAVEHPEIVPMHSVASAFTPADLRLGRLLRTDECLRLWPVSNGVNPG